ncbi:MAG: MFS transporter [Chloroflexi bacterium]|nr:MFS transporter [Chloroflexota bacterium]
MLPLFVLAHTGHHLVSALLTPLLPFIRDELSLDYTQAGVLFSAFNISYGISQLPAGWLADRIGPRITLTIGVAGVAAAGLLAGLSQTYLMLAAVLVLMGLAGGGYHPSAAPLVSASVEPKNRGRALGIHQIGGTVSFFLAPIIAAGIAGALGWRGTFITLSIPTIAFGLVFYALLGRLGQTSRPKPASAAPTEALPAPVNRRRLMAFLILGIASMVLIYSTITFIPLYVVDHLGESKKIGATMVALVFSGGIWAGPLGGYLSDRIGRVPVLLAVGLIGGPAIYLMTLTPYGLALWAILIIIGMAMHLGMPVVEAYIISHTPEHRRSTVLGIYYLGSRGGPGVMAPVIGYFIDNYGFTTSFSLVAAAVIAVTLFCAMLLWGNRD